MIIPINEVTALANVGGFYIRANAESCYYGGTGNALVQLGADGFNVYWDEIQLWFA
jgi:hypothetical protein